MTRNAPLRVVTPDETPAKRRALMTVTAAAAEGSRADLLVALRGRIAKAVEDPGTPTHALASLTRRLLEITTELQKIDEADPDEPDVPAPGDEPFDPTTI